MIPSAMFAGGRDFGRQAPGAVSILIAPPHDEPSPRKHHTPLSRNSSASNPASRFRHGPSGGARRPQFNTIPWPALAAAATKQLTNGN